LVVWLLSESFPSAAEDRTNSGGAFREGFSPFVSEKLSARARRAVNDAAQLLADPGCRAVLLDFQDRAGRPLHATLDQAGQDAVGYLAGIRFADGSGRRPCVPGTTLAFTSPGSRVVHLCARQFELTQRRNPLLASRMVIHEMLHTLGLGENPPSTHEITSRIARRCRPPRLTISKRR
jgi:hypothetical protein